MFERMAHVIWLGRDADSDDETIARELIKEMRDPTDAMARVGGGEGAVNVWHAMIDAVLGEDGP